MPIMLSHPDSQPYPSLLAAIEAFIHTPDSSIPDFDTIATQLFHYQYQNNAPYRNYVDSIGLKDIEHWSQIPAVSTNAFKTITPPTCLNPSQAAHLFTTSGTTSKTKGTHYFRNTELYETSILAAWDQLNLPHIHTLFLLTPSPDEAPHSSLSHMMETLRHRYAPQAQYLIQNDRIQTAPLLEAAQQGTPLTLLGTALGFLNLFEQLDTALTLPTGSWAMETGGYKGSGRSLSKETLYHLFQQHLHIPASHIWNEYSMTELSSQSYTQALNHPHRTPHWMKIQVLDPDTDRPVQVGKMGYLVLYDLANIDSALAIRTQDIAIYHDEHCFTLIGRDPAALPRGCSRSIDASLNL